MYTIGEGNIEALVALKYPEVESLVDNGSVKSLSLGDFSKVVNWLSDELNDFLKLDQVVNKITNESDVDSFKIELNSLLRELQSPFTRSNLDDEANRVAIIHYLCGELIAARILHVNKPDDGDGMKIDMTESETARDLKASMIILGIGKPPPNVTSPQLFAKMKEKISEKVKKSTLTHEEPLLLKSGCQLSVKDWETLDKINNSLKDDYSVRRQTLITRCDCTIGSFKWKEGENPGDTNLSQKIDPCYNKLRPILDPKPGVNMALALAARESGCYDLLNSVVSKSHQVCDIKAPKTKGMANIGKQQRISLQNFLIGNVPDRGGRPFEQPPPPQETFSQQQQQRQNPRGGGHHRGGGGHHQHHSQPRGQYQQRDSYSQHNQPYQQQYSGDKPHHQSYQSRGQYQDSYQSGYQSHDNQRGGHGGRGGGRGGRGGYQDYRGGGRVQGAGWNQGYQRY